MSREIAMFLIIAFFLLVIALVIIQIFVLPMNDQLAELTTWWAC